MNSPDFWISQIYSFFIASASSEFFAMMVIKSPIVKKIIADDPHINSFFSSLIQARFEFIFNIKKYINYFHHFSASFDFDGTSFIVTDTRVECCENCENWKESELGEMELLNFSPTRSSRALISTNLTEKKRRFIDFRYFPPICHVLHSFIRKTDDKKRRKNENKIPTRYEHKERSR